MNKTIRLGCRKQNHFSPAKIMNVMQCILIWIILLTLSVLSCNKDKTVTSGASNQISSSIIPNSDFENWSFGPLPENWQTNSCPMCVPPWETYIAQKDSQVVYNGKYCLKLIYNLTIPTPGCQQCEPGCCSGSGLGPTWAKNKFAISNHPSSLHGYVKCIVRGTDTVSISIKLLNNGIPVDSGQWRRTASINNWTEVNIPISQSVTAIDSALIIITGGKYKDSTTNLTNSTTFWVDYLSLLK